MIESLSWVGGGDFFEALPLRTPYPLRRRYLALEWAVPPATEVLSARVGRVCLERVDLPCYP